MGQKAARWTFLLAPVTPVPITIEVAIASFSSSIPEVASIAPGVSEDPPVQPRVTPWPATVPATISSVVAVNKLGALLIEATISAPVAALAESLGRHGQHEQGQDRRSNQLSRNR